MYSPQSHQLAVGSSVSKKTVEAITNMTHPTILLTFLKLSIDNCMVIINSIWHGENKTFNRTTF
jgi:hypothetical protein